MKTYMGIWLDHEKAYLCKLKKEDPSIPIKEDEKDAPEFETIESGVEKHVRLAGGSRTRKTPFGPQDVADEKKIDRRRDLELKRYYKTILDRLQNVDKLFILGPGEAKNELRKELEKTNMPHIKSLETQKADKMTKNQLIASIKQHFT